MGFILSRLDLPQNDAARNDTYKRFRILINGNSFCQAVLTAGLSLRKPIRNA